MNELTKRIHFALVAAPVFLWILAEGGIAFTALMLLITILIQFEVIHIARKSDLAPNRFFTYLGGGLIALMPFYPMLVPVGLVLFVVLVSYETLFAPERDVKHMFSTFFCMMYAPMAMASFSLLRLGSDSPKGAALSLLLVLAIWGVDTLSYFGGRLLGKHLLAEKLSPKKTWEGFFSGLLLGGAAGAAVLIFGYQLFGITFPFTWPEIIPVLIIAGTIGPIGDLAESKLKRTAGVKDSGTLLPGHGGFFDRFDSLLLSAPAAFVYAHWILKL